MQHRFALLLLATSVLGAAAPTAFASGGGGGGGGGGFSGSSSSYDAVEEYRNGVAYLEAQEYKKAETAFERVIDVAPDHAGANYLLGVAYEAQAKDKLAQRAYKKAVRQDGNIIDARLRLALISVKLGDSDAALAERAVLAGRRAACDEPCADAEALDQAVASIDSALAGTPVTTSYNGAAHNNVRRQAADATYLEAIRQINLKHYDTAVGALSEAAYVFGPHPDILTYQGFVARKRGEADAARQFYAAALRIDPAHRGATEYLGEFYVEQGDLRRARQLLARLERDCVFGCPEAEELRRWVDGAAS